MRLLLLLLPVLFSVAAYGLDAVQLNRLATEAFHGGRYLQSLDYLRQAERQSPYNEQIRRNLAEVLLAASGQSADRGDWDRSVALLQEGIDRYPDDARFPLEQAGILLHLDRLSEAEVLANSVLGIQPESVAARLILGRVYYQSGRLREAIDVWRKAADLDPEDRRISEMLARAEREYQVEAGMTRDYGPGFVLSYDDAAHGRLSQDILDVLNQAYIEVGSLLKHFPDQKVEVLVYTRRQFRQSTDSPDWAGGVYDGKIRIPLGGIEKMTEPLRALLFHEYAHVVVRRLSHGRCPVWFNEGIAEVMAAGQYSDGHVVPLRATNMIPFEQLEDSWRDLGPVRARMAYRQSRSFVGFLADNYGWHTIGDLLSVMAGGKKTDQAFAEVFGDYGLDFAGIVETWRRRELD
ncbi:MAG: tetratricopeptide repeat protein [Geothermobacteraceae bacterium]